MNATMNVIANRVSLRRYRQQPITREDQELILEAAMRAPTAGNMQLYSILIIADPEKKQILSRTCDNQGFIAEAPLVLLFLADLQRWQDYFSLCDLESFCRRRQSALHRPTVADLYLAVNDALLAAQNAVIAAESIGIGSCYIGDIAEQYETHRELLQWPDFVFPAAMLTLGYYPEGFTRQQTPRLPQEAVVFTDGYQRLRPEQLKAAYAEREAALPRPNAHRADNFGQYIYARKMGAPFYQEMERSLKAAMKSWLSGSEDAPL